MTPEKRKDMLDAAIRGVPTAIIAKTYGVTVAEAEDAIKKEALLRTRKTGKKLEVKPRKEAAKKKFTKDAYGICDMDGNLFLTRKVSRAGFVWRISALRREKWEKSLRRG